MTADGFANSAHKRHGWKPILIILAGWAILNAFTLSRMPFVWLDEVYFTDPAVNLVRGDGFVSRAWDNSPETRIVASTSPLYSLSLAAWLEFFGTNVVAVRSFGLFLVGLGTIVLWSACHRWQLASPGWIALVCTAILCSYGFAFSYRSARPESIIFLAWSLLLHASSWKPSSLRRATIFLVGAFHPFMGQAACVALAVLASAAVLVARRRWLGAAALLLLGIVTGTIAFVALYKYLGIWPDFHHAVMTHGGTPWQRLFRRLTSNPATQHQNTIPKDPTLLLLVVGIAAVSLRACYSRSFRTRPVLCFVVIYSVGLSLSLYLLGKFPTYYAWMLGAPIALVYASEVNEEENRSQRTRLAARGLLLGGSLVGLPLQLAIAAWDWNDRDYLAVSKWIGDTLRPDDIAFVDYPFYYAARRRSAKVYLVDYAAQLRPEDVAAVTAMVISPHRLFGLGREELFQKMGPHWMKIQERRAGRGSLLGNDWQAGLISAPNYDGDVFRRSQ